jgi:hypothetical protein
MMRATSRLGSGLAVFLVLSACGSPSSPDGGGIQAHLDRATPDLKVNGATIQPGSTANIAVGSRADFRIDFTNRSGQNLHLAVVFVRDDGIERLLLCSVSGSGGEGGGSGAGTTIFPEDRGHTVRVMLLGAYGPSSQCLLQSSTGSFQVNHANVQAQRLLATFAVQ